MNFWGGGVQPLEVLKDFGRLAEFEPRRAAREVFLGTMETKDRDRIQSKKKRKNKARRQESKRTSLKTRKENECK